MMVCRQPAKRGDRRGRWMLFLLLLLLAPSGRTQPIQSVTLEQAVSEAVARNLDVQAEKNNVSVAEARVITASLRPNPILTLDGDHLDLLGTGYNRINAAGPPEYSARTDFIWERGGKRQRRID